MWLINALELFADTKTCLLEKKSMAVAHVWWFLGFRSEDSPFLWSYLCLYMLIPCFLMLSWCLSHLSDFHIQHQPSQAILTIHLYPGIIHYNSIELNHLHTQIYIYILIVPSLLAVTTFPRQDLVRRFIETRWLGSLLIQIQSSKSPTIIQLLYSSFLILVFNRKSSMTIIHI